MSEDECDLESLCDSHCEGNDYYYTPCQRSNGRNVCGEQQIEHDSPYCKSDGNGDSCTGVTCQNTCDGTSLWSQKCVGGHCVKDALIKTDSPYCKHVELPSEKDIIDNISDMLGLSRMQIIYAGIIAIFILLIRS